MRWPKERLQAEDPGPSGEHLRNCSFKYSLMPTIPVPEETKARLGALKPRGVTWDQMLRWMLEVRDPADWADAFRDRAQREGAVLRARRLRSEGARSVTRDPGEQVALAEVARRRWKMWEETGRVEEIGPRRFRLKPPPEGEEADVTIRRVREGP